MDFRELEETLTRLESVDAVRVVGDRNRVAEVHVLAATGKPAKQVVRDIQSLAMAQYGANIDRRTISVVQIAPSRLPHDDAERPVLVGIQDQPNGSATRIAVTLGWQAGEVTGSATGSSAASARARLIGEATLHAVEDMFEETPAMALDAIGPASIGVREIMIAVVVSGRDRDEQVSVGAVLRGADESEAVVRAVLDAINRRLPRLGAGTSG